MNSTLLAQLAPGGVLRAAINLSNFLLVSGEDPVAGWRGISPDLAALVAQRLGVRLELVAYATPAEIAASAGSGPWTMALLGADPLRSSIAFTSAYAEIKAGYLVPPASPLQRLEDVDRPGVSILAFGGSAYGLWLEGNLRHAELRHASSIADSLARLRAGEADALASLMPKLLEDAASWPGSRILDGAFMTVQQAIGVPAGNDEAIAFLREFVEEVRATRLVETLIRKHGVVGLTASA